MTDQPGTNSSILGRQTTYVVTISVTGAPHTPRPYTKQVINPKLVKLEWIVVDGYPDLLRAEVYGARVLKDGSDGQTISERFWSADDLPAWVVELASSYRGQVLR